MAHFAKLDENNVVLEVHVVNNACLDSSNEEQSGIDFLREWSGGHNRWKQTSYNGSFRKNYAGIGYTYDEKADVFVEPQPYLSWTLDENHDWQPPVPYPNDGVMYIWNEETKNWEAINFN